MPTKQICAACVTRACDHTAIVFKRHSPSGDFAQSRTEAIPGLFCEPVAWLQVFHSLRTRGPEYIGGEVRQGVFAGIDGVSRKGSGA